MISKILIVLAVIIVVFIVIVAFQPSASHIERSITVAATPLSVFEEINDLSRFQAWNPWAKIDPAMNSTYSGPPAGVGASYAWAGNNQVGEGRMTIVESTPGERVALRMEFLKPFASTSTAAFVITPAANQTSVTWSMDGEQNFFAKAIGLFVNMDKMIGGEFEKGLADLKSIAERK